MIIFDLFFYLKQNSPRASCFHGAHILTEVNSKVQIYGCFKVCGCNLLFDQEKCAVVLIRNQD